MEAPVPMDNKSKTLPPYGNMVPSFNHHPPALHGPPLGGPPPGPPRIPPREGPHGLPAPIPHVNTYEQPWRQQPYPPPHFESPVERRHSTPVTNPPPPPSQPPPTHIPYPTAPPPPPPPHPAQQQSRELPQLPPGDPYHRPNSLPAPAPSHSLPEDHSPRGHYRPMNGAQPEPTPHSAPPPPNEYRPPRIPYTGPPESPIQVTSNGDHPGPPPGYMPNVPPSYHGQPPPGAAYDANIPYARQRKAARAQQACDQCRARKAKCDEGRPSCSHCKENNVLCVYKEVPPHKQEKTTQIILDRIERKEEVMKELLENIVKKIAATDSRVDRLFDYFSEQGHTLPDQKSSSIATTSSEPKKTSEKEHKEESTLITEKNEVAMSIEKYNESLGKESSQMLQTEMKVEEEEGELSIPIEHTTAAHKLLSWPSINRLLDRRVDEDYVLTNERKRGLIRIYGCGEGRDHDTEYNYPRAQPVPVPAAAATDSPATTTSTSSPRFDDDHAQAASPNWGYGLPVTPSGRPGERHGGLDQTGYLNTQPEVVRQHHRSFMANIHVLHPFLDAATLEQKVERFIRQYGYRKSIVNSVSGSAGEMRGMKRKRSTETMHMGPHDMSRSPSMNSEKRPPPNRIERSIDNAIILMVLALGAICEHKGPIPGFASDPSGRSQTQAFAVSPEAQAVFNDILSPSSGSMSAVTGQSFQSPNVPSPDVAFDWKTPTPRLASNKIGQDSYAEDSYPRNVDVIPGLAYYAYAAGILGDLQGGNELPYVQAAILASFYAGQLAHPFQSHGWIFQAARACQFIVRARDYSVMPNGPLKELYEFAFWTCLQHESDLLAELDLAASGISRSESRITLPAGVYTLTLPNEIDAPETRMMFYYSAQIHLRKVLNRVHTDLYKVHKKGGKMSDKTGDKDMEESIEEKPDSESKELNIPYKVLQVLGMNLEVWKGNLPPIMQWGEKEPPSSDINTARLRAKYYGARYIIYRPLLHYALHQLAPPKTEPSASAESQSFTEQSESKRRVSSFMSQGHQAPGMARWASETGTSQHMEDEANIYPTIKFETLDPQIQQACYHCIRAAVQSTIAFDGVKGRPIVTNIFGTAHAQFGNMLVLSATYMSGLRQLVERDELERLLKRTIRFLAQSKDISPTLRADAQILSGIYHKIFKQSPHTSFTTESFGPNT